MKFTFMLFFNNKKQIRTNFDLRNSSDLFRLVEPRGVEPLSENLFIQLSPSADSLLNFPLISPSVRLYEKYLFYSRRIQQEKSPFAFITA